MIYGVIGCVDDIIARLRSAAVKKDIRMLTITSVVHLVVQRTVISYLTVCVFLIKPCLSTFTR